MNEPASISPSRKANRHSTEFEANANSVTTVSSSVRPDTGRPYHSPTDRNSVAHGPLALFLQNKLDKTSPYMAML